MAGPLVPELRTAWSETAPRLLVKKLLIDLRDVTYTDPSGKRVLRDIFSESDAELVISSPFTHHLAQKTKSAK